MANDKNFKVKNGLDVGDKTTITSSGTIGLSTIANGYLQITNGANTLAFDPNEIYGDLDLNIGTASGDIDLRPSTGIIHVYDGANESTLSYTKIGQWDSSYTYSQTGHLPLTGGTLTGDTSVETALNPTITIKSTDTTVVANEVIGTLEFIGTDDATGGILAGQIQQVAAQGADWGSGNYGSNMSFSIKESGSGASFVEKLRLQTSGVVINGTISATDYNDTNWNTAYAYSQTGHLPLTGGTITGALIGTDITAGGYLQATSFLYTRNNLRVLNAAGTGWNTWGTRVAGNYNLSVGTISLTGALTGTSAEFSSSVEANNFNVVGGAFIARNPGLTNGSLWLATNASGTTSADRVVIAGGTSAYSYHDANGIDIRQGGLASNGTLVLDINRNLTNIGTISSGIITATGGTSTNWNTAYGWGDHALAGYAADSSLANYLPLSGGTLTGALVGTTASFIGGTTKLQIIQSGTVNQLISSTGTFAATPLAFKIAGSEAMRITAAGNVGIGTTSPSAKLTIETANESLYDVLGVHNGITGTSALGKGAAIRIGSGSNGNYSTKIATIYEGNNPSYLQPALAFFTMNNTYLKDSETEKMRISANGNVGIGTSSPATTLTVTGNGANGIELDRNLAAAAQSARLFFDSSAGGTAIVNYDGDTVFTTGAAAGSASGTERLRIDSAGTVSIGNFFSVSSSATVDLTNVRAGSGSAGSPAYTFGGDPNTGLYRPTADALAVTTAGSEKMRIDSAGNLLVGKTAASSATVGFQAGQDGFTAITRASGQPLVLNRTTTDGIIADFRKDGTTVGSIGTVDGDLLIHSSASGHKGLRLGNGYVAPTNNAGATEDNTTDLGLSSQRWKDLHLSGTGYFGTSVGIGTSSPDAPLHISKAATGINAATTVLKLSSVDTNTAQYVGFQTQRDNSAGQGLNILVTNVVGTVSEAMRVSPDGNLLVGKTSADNTTAGVTIYGSVAPGAASFVREAGNTLVLNRLTSDGEILAFRKDGTTVGSIGTDSGFLHVGQGNSNLLFIDSGQPRVIPRKTIGTSSNGFADLGDSNSRFKDLYLSGSAIVGGGGTTQTGVISFVADSERARIEGGYQSGGGGYLKFNTDTAGGSNLERMRIDSAGNVGIGTSSPAAKLQVDGAIVSEGGSFTSGLETATDAGLIIQKNDYIYSDDNSYLRRIIGHASTGILEIGQGGTALISDITLKPGLTGNIRFFGSGSEDVRINSSGNMGIGTTLPERKLHIFNGESGALASNVNSAMVIEDDSNQYISFLSPTFLEAGLLFGDSGDNDAGALTYNHLIDRMSFKAGGVNGVLSIESTGINVNGNITSTADNSFLTMGVPGAGATVGARYLSIEGNTGTDGEGSSRIFFTEHNSTTAAMDNYGMSLGYRGGATSIEGASGNTWTGLTAIGNGEWGMWGHDNNATGSLIMSGDRAGTVVRFNSTIDLLGNNIAVDTNKGFVNSGSWTRNQTPYGYIDFGPANDGWAHIYTDRPAFYFNKELYVNSARVFHDSFHPNADKWTTARTLTLNGDVTGSVSWDGSANATLTTAVGNDSHSHSNYTPLDHIRSLGTTAFTAGGGSNSTTTTAALIAEMESDGAFDSSSSVFKTSWSYASNDDLTDAGRFTETAGTSWLTWTDNSSDTTRGYITALAIAPNSGGSAGKMFVYNDQGPSYSPGWREIWTSTSDGPGSGLDADLLDGVQGSGYVNTTGTQTVGGAKTFSNTVTLTGSQTGNFPQLRLTAGVSNNAKIQFGDSDDIDIGVIQYSNSDNSMTFLTNTGERLRITSAGNAGIGTTTPQGKLSVSNNGAEGIEFFPANQSGLNTTQHYNRSGTAYVINKIIASEHRFNIGGNEKVRINTLGQLLVNKTASSTGTAGVELQSGTGAFSAVVATATAQPLLLNKLSAEGSIAVFRKDNTNAGQINVHGTATDSYISMGNKAAGLQYVSYQQAQYIRPFNVLSNLPNDNSLDLGQSNARFDDVYATNGTIQTSDRNEKQDIEELSDAETRVAVACKGLLRKFRWKDSVDEKGDEARTHFGIIAQDLQDAFSSEGLNASDYAMFISTTWTDEETNEEKTRLGVRYSELLAFIIAAL